MRPSSEKAFVDVRKYVRYRLANWETVRRHQRRWPQPR